MKCISLQKLESEPISHNPMVLKKTLIRRGELPNLTALAEAVFPPGQKAGAHTHQSMAEIFFVQSGGGVIRLNGRPFDLTPGTCAVAEPGDVHEIENDGDEPLVILFFGLQG